MAKTRISSADLLWIFRERLSSLDKRFKVAPIAILPSKNGWEAITPHRYRTGGPQFAKLVDQVQAELRATYRLTRD